MINRFNIKVGIELSVASVEFLCIGFGLFFEPNSALKHRNADEWQKICVWLGNGYIANENQCCSTESKGSFSSSKNQKETENLAYSFYGFTKSAFLDSSISLHSFFFFFIK